MRTRGFILIIALAILGLLAFLALEIVQSSQQARLLSYRGIYLSKATLAARSGLEKAVQSTQGILNRSVAPSWAVTQNLMSAGEDSNVNGVLDGGEDLDGNGRISLAQLERDPTPSLVLREGGQCLREPVEGGRIRGVSWRNDGAASDLLCTLRITVPCLDLNAGVRSGNGPEGQRFQLEQGTPYAASNLSHPFNIPLKRLLNAWGNYHKYQAMVRPSKTYNFDRSTKFGKVDGTDNLMASAITARSPFTRFDDFNPSGNHLTTALGASVNSEFPLGDLVLSARPSTGFRNLEEVLPIVEAYVRSWVDKAGRRADDSTNPWRYADGTPMPLVGAERARDIVDEFAGLAALEPERKPSWIFRPGAASAAPANEPASPGYFEQHANRHYLYTKIYSVPALQVDVTRAPPSVLAALVHAPGRIQARFYDRQGSQMGAFQPLIPYQSENNVPCFHSYGGADRNWISGKPLFSMTESIRLAADLTAERSLSSFGLSMAGLREFLRSWHRGYDAKFHEVYSPNFHFNTVDWGMPAAQFDVVSNYYDWYHGHRRVQALAELLNPHPNDARVVWDEALPLAMENRKNRLTWANNPFQGAFFMLDEAEGAQMEKGPEACFCSTKILVSSLGWHKPTGIRRLLSTGVRIFRHVSLGTQKDFDAIGRNPTTLASTLGPWTTYPEPPGVAVSTWTGHLALKPSTQEAPWGENLLLRVPLNSALADSTRPRNAVGTTVPAWTAGARHLQGPSEIPARGILRNSLQPAPGGALTSLYPQIPTEINTACDLLPGGGIRMSPWHNSVAQVSALLPNWPNHKEALLVLRNSLVSDADDNLLPKASHIPAGPPPFVLPGFHEGAVSFYVKPRFQPEIANANNGAASTLFFMPFTVFDAETQQRCIALGMTPAISKIRSQYVGSLRLTWSSSLMFLNTITRLYVVPGINDRWPMIVPFAGFPGQVASGPFYFSNMEGHMDAASNKGFVLTPNTAVNGAYFNANPVAGGDGIEGHWRAPNPFAREDLVLEWEISKYADHPEDGSSFIVSPPITPGSVTPRWHIWEAADAFSPLAERTAYQNLIALGRPLYLFDTSDPAHPEYHYVKKAFILHRPVKTSPGADRGAGPRDPRGDHQALLESGRWNHVFIAWRNLWQVLGNSPPTMGGCISVYVNGSFRKNSPEGYATRSLFMNYYMSSAYRATNTGGLNYLAWDPGYHSRYQSTSYSGPGNTFSAPPIFLRGFSVPNQPGVNLMRFPPMISNGVLAPMAYHSPYYQHNSNLQLSQRKQQILMRFPPRFYFGFEPHSILAYNAPPIRTDYHNYFASNITWGSFMDLQVFDKATQIGLASPLALVDGGFRPDLPGFYGPATPFSPYPSGTTVPQALLYPLLAQPCIEALKAQNTLVGLSWSAHLPGYHRFWDDQNPAIAGPDANDIQTLEMEIGLFGATAGTLASSQLPGAQPQRGWGAASPAAVKTAADLTFTLKFKGPPVVMSTPLIENIDLVFARKTPLYDAMIME